MDINKRMSELSSVRWDLEDLSAKLNSFITQARHSKSINSQELSSFMRMLDKCKQNIAIVRDRAVCGYMD